MSELDFARFIYCQHMSSTFMAVNKFEDMVINAMLMCNRIQTKKVLRSGIKAWERMLERREHLQQSTLGTLISILERNAIDNADVAYLRWVKDKRDYFVHRLFHDGAWPGELDADECTAMTRRLMAIRLWLGRAERRIWYIFERAGLVHLTDIKGHGMLAMNADIFKELSEINPDEAPANST